MPSGQKDKLWTNLVDGSVRCQTDIVVVDDALPALFLMVASVLDNGAKLDGVENIRLFRA